MKSSNRARWGRRGTLAGLIVIILVPLTRAQAPDLVALRKTPLSDAAAREQVQTWLAQQVADLFASNDPLEDGAKYYDLLKQHLLNQDATSGFKTQMAAIQAAVFTAQYKPPAAGQPNPAPLPTVFTLLAMKLAPNVAALPCYRSALADPSSGVRLVATDGLLGLKIPSDQFNAIFQQVAQVAVNESNPAVLSRQWRVLTQGGQAADADVAKALLAILEARVVRFEQQGESPSVVDVNILNWLAGKLPQLNDAAIRNQVIQLTARVMTDAVYVYVNDRPGEFLSQRLEVVIRSTEEALGKLVKAPANTKLPSVTKAMTGGGEAVHDAMQAAVIGWVGNADEDGVLNGDPYRFPRGLGIERPENKGESN